jgi:pimeloyl-ACP methyl ester carboxylesterase
MHPDTATYLLLPGAGGDSWYWHRVAPLLRERGHEVIAPDLPCDDDAAGLAEYADAAVAASGDREGIVLVAQSMAAFSAPIACARLDVALLVLLAPMIPAPGETPGTWWSASGQVAAHRAAEIRAGRDPDAPFDVRTGFFHDVPDAVVAEAFARGAPRQSDTPFAQPWPLAAWPDVPTRVLAGRHDRLFPLEFVRRLSEERLGVTPDVVDAGHLAALSRPADVAERLERYRLTAGLSASAPSAAPTGS